MYDEEIRQFISDLRVSLGRGTDIKKSGLAGVKLTGSLMSLSPSRGGGGGGISQSMADVFSSAGGGGVGGGAGEGGVGRPKFDQAFSVVLEQLQPVCVSEQKFLTAFFHFAKPERPQEMDQPGGGNISMYVLVAHVKASLILMPYILHVYFKAGNSIL